MDKWASNDQFIVENLIREDVSQIRAMQARRENELPEMEVSPAQGKFLYLIARIRNAQRILEIGTFCGYSTIWLAKAVPDDGIVISLEHNESCVEIARRSLERSGLSCKAKVIHGDAIELLRSLVEENCEPFDMIFIDADKPNYSKYLELSLKLSKPGTVIYGDNVIRDGELCNPATSDPKVEGVRTFIENMGELGKIESTAIQTVGVKGYDGFTLSVVL